MHLVPRQLSDLSKLVHSMSGVFEGAEDTHVQVVAFKGVYDVGSRGNADAAYMRAIVEAAAAGWDCLALVLDLREFEYSWGGALLGVLHAAEQLHHGEDDPPFPVKIVVSDGCRDGLESLLHTAEGASAGWELFDSVDDAVQAARESIRPYLDD